MIKILPNLKQQFCEKFWRKKPRLSKRDFLELQNALYSVNLKLLTGEGPSLESYKRRFGYSFNKIITVTDNEFKSLNKTKKEMTVYRGISEPKEYDHPLLKKLYQDSFNTKKDDIIAARGYTFAAIRKSLGELFGFYGGKSGILYEIKVPKGARLSVKSDEVVFPRYSQFKCLKSEKIVNDDGQYMFKRIEYIVPKEKSGWFYNIFK